MKKILLLLNVVFNEVYVFKRIKEVNKTPNKVSLFLLKLIIIKFLRPYS